MEDELWLKKLKERLDDYSEPVPASGWKRLEKELSAAGKTAPVLRRIAPFRRWAVAAAAALLVAISSVSLWLLQSPVGDEVRSASASALAVTPDALPEQAMPVMRTHPSEPIMRVKEDVSATAHQANRSWVARRIEVPVVAEKDKAEEEALPVEAESAVETETADETVERQPEEKRVGKEVRKERYRPSGRDKLHLPDKKKSAIRSSSKRVGVGMFVGNTGGFSLAREGYMYYNVPDKSSNDVNTELLSSANGVFVVSEGQELVFKNGLPYIQSCESRIVDIDHKQPLSFGVSVRKNLAKGFSVESGLTYTYLASDVKFEGRSGKVGQKLHYLGIPVRGNWDFVDTKNFTMYVSAGGAIEKCVYGKMGAKKETVKPVQLSVMGAVGAQYNLSDRAGIYIEPGVSYFFDDGSPVQTIRKENPCNFTLQAGIRLTY